MKPTILFVDDEPHVTHSLTRALYGRPYALLRAHSSQEALALLAQQPIDIVIADEKMPGLPGSELLALVRKQFPHTIRMVLTGQASIEAAVRAINEGAIHRWLMKPCGTMELLEAIEATLKDQASRVSTDTVLRVLKQDSEPPP